ncbi:propionyl-CoA synthetase [Insolitispirillum peregrinum]|uniref:Propionyl-CoA synthetase n=1 Tax=Insolitispirillum peregrinum TaxID=80876 RepID=A0A1N7IR78_9PROT|nr:propionyl-CoA synthetase [Insolitispirillum peregrinum]SIS39567.1 propionyl-CoA synthetase [Insolitispirillum peregrinum]
MTNAYEIAHKTSLQDPETFWGEAAKDIAWVKPADKVLDDSAAPLYRWFVGGELNTCYNAVDRHVEAGRGEQTAIIYDSPITGAKRKISYAELQDQVARFAGVLAGQGVTKGDRVIVYMPMIPEALVAMLACARLGAIHSVVFGGFAPHELATRIDDAKPTALVCASCGLEPGRVVRYKPNIDAAIDYASHKVGSVVVFQREQEKADLIPGRDVDWAEAVAKAEPHPCVTVAATDPLYILYTSGTTGQPKGVVRDNGGHAVALRWTMTNLYNVQPGDVYWAASDVGWVVGHSYICYAPLLTGCTTVVFEGKPVGTPDAGTFWRVIEEYKVKLLFTAPTAFRAIRREDPNGEFLKKYDRSSLQSLFLAGERSDPETLKWAEEHLQVPVVDHWWQTETGWAICGNPLGLTQFPVKHGSPTKAMPGWDVQVVDEGRHQVEPGQIGSLVCKLPLPPGTLPTLWNAEARYISSYLEEFPGYYKTGDAGFIDDEGYIYVMTRTDDVINVAGHRLSTGAMEEVLAKHPDVAECAVIGVADDLKGQTPLGFVCLKMGVTRSEDDIRKELVKLVRDEIGPVAAFKQAVIVKRLPKTRSGKILRGTMQKIADNQDFKMPATIDDPDILPEIEEALEGIGLAKKRTDAAL